MSCKCEFQRTGRFLHYATGNLVEVKCIHCGFTTYYGVNDLQRINMVVSENYTCLID